MSAADRDVDLESAPISATSPQHPVVVVGGGVVGACCASYLAEAGAPVVLIDRAEMGVGASHGNCGFVSPSHVLPLSKPGAALSTLRLLLKRNSPFHLRLRFDPSLWGWMWRFLQHCNEADMLRSGYARQALLNSSRSLYDELMSSRALLDCEWDARGLYFVYRTHEHFEEYEKVDRLLRDEFELPAKQVSAKELLESEPALKPNVAGAWFYQCDAQLRPNKLVDAWRRRLLEQGVAVRENCEFIGLESGDGRVSAIQTSSGRLEVDQVVIATGAWTRLLQDHLEIKVPIQPGKGYSITVKRPENCPKTPMIFEEDRVAFTPMDTGFRIGSTMEFAGFDDSIRPERVRLLTDGAKNYLKETISEPFEETWCGWRPMSADDVPLIGRSPHHNNVWVAAGHGMLGVSMSPATGKLVAELMTGQTPHLDPAPYRLDRF